MKVSHILDNKGAEYSSIAPEKRLIDAVALMMENRIGSIVVAEGGHIVGIVTERDVMRAVHQFGPDLNSVNVADVMSSDLVSCDRDDALDDVMSLMIDNPRKHGIRHLPVMDGQTLVGIISMRDIVKALLTEIRFENKLLKNYIRNWPEQEDA